MATNHQNNGNGEVKAAEKTGVVIRFELLTLICLVLGNAAASIWWASAIESQQTSMDKSNSAFQASVTTKLDQMADNMSDLKDVVYEVRAAQRVTDAAVVEIRRRQDAMEANRR